MATIKSYTDLKQSKKLAEILPLESADMCYVIDYAESNKYGTDHFKLEVDTYGLKVKTRDNIPCWSLTALLEVLDYPQLSEDKLGNGKKGWMVSTYPDNCRYDSCWHDNPVDACIEMILKLYELKM